MSRSSNSLRVSDVITTPIKLKYTSSYDCSTLGGAGIVVYDGENGPVTVTGSVSLNTLVYRSINQLYYASYTSGSLVSNVLSGSYPATTSSFDISIQSTAAFGTLDADVRNFPTGAYDQIRVVSIPRNVFGQKISRQGFYFSSSAYVVVDDGNGNLIDVTGLQYVFDQYYTPEYIDWYVYGPLAHVGNIIYRQGMVIITNPNYLSMFPSAPIARPDTTTFYTTTNPKTLNILANDSDGTGTLDYQSVVLSGPSASLFTYNGNGTVTLNTNTVGTYTVNYTVNNTFGTGCGLTSNVTQVTVNVVTPPCNCTTYRVTYRLRTGSATFSYESCTTRTIEYVTLDTANTTIEICSCQGQINYNPRTFTVTTIGTGCVADCSLAGTVQVV